MTRIGDLLQGSKIAEQIELETESISEGVARYRRLAREAVDRCDGAALKPAERLVVYWFEPLVMAIRDEHKKIRKGAPGRGRSVYGPVLWKLDAERTAVIAMHEMLSRCMISWRGDSIQKMSYAIGNAVLAEINQDTMRAEGGAGIKELDRRYKRRTPARINRWAKKTLDDPLWQRKVCTHVGAIMIQLVLGVATVKGYKKDEWVPAFERGYVWIEGKRVGHINLTPQANDLIEDGHLFRQHLRPQYLPMVIPPYPWGIEGTEGGYARVRTPFISKPTREQRQAVAEADVELTCEGLNAINSTAWTYSRWMVNLQRQLWNSGGGVGVIPRPDNEPMPDKPSDMSENLESLKSWKADAHEVHTINAKRRGARLEFLQRLSIAEKLIDQEKIFLPHQFCFRYRHYPIPARAPNHHGDDASRSMLLFARGLPLDDTGREQLYIQIANSYGRDKVSFADRVAFVETNMDQFIEFAQRPEDTAHLWGEADDPLQFVHACRALIDPELAAHLPGKVDGSANGNQHYAADNRDEEAGRRVNLVPADTPNDPYQDVVADVARVVELGASSSELDRMCLPFITRKICKRPSMTRVYNSTRIGARNMVLEELMKAALPRDLRGKIAHRLSGVIFDSVSDLFPSATLTMKWIEQCIRMMVNHDPTRTIRWTNPLGAPVVQPYRNTRKYRVRTCLSEIILGHRDTDAPVSLSKQVQGGPANWVHCLDGGHSMLTGLEMYDQDKDYGSVHDAYWAHLMNMVSLGDIARHQFVEMHLTDLSGHLYAEWSESYPTLNLPCPPSKGTLDLMVVKQSPYFFA